jgi:uncharacterized protein (DUF1684 family)
MTDSVANSRVELWDWRRQVADLYGEVRRADDPESAWHHWRRSRDGLFRQHPQSPLEGDARAGFSGLRYFAYDPAFRFSVALEGVTEAAAELVPAGEDGEVPLVPFARTRGLAPRLGAELTLYWIGGYGGGAFLPFRDASAGEATFGGGRYLLDSLKGADLGLADTGAVLLDFNFAYNPSCAYAARWVCPLAPAANHLPEPLPAGEKAFA